MKQETDEWVDKAEGDRQVAQREMQADTPVHDVICFLAQQCAEKYLKGWLVERGIPFTRVHDLVVLLEGTGTGLPELQPERGSLARLAAFAVSFRYPGQTATVQDAIESVRIANQVRAANRHDLGLSV